MTAAHTIRTPHMAIARRADTERHVTTRDGTLLAVTDHGPRSAPATVIFLHGLCLNQTAWTHHAALLRRRYGPAVRTITYDHRGHGASTAATTDSYTVEQLGADLAEVMTALGVAGRVVLAGHSMGAMAALAFLTAGEYRPVNPEGLVLAATAAGGLTDHGLGRLLNTPGFDLLSAAVDHTPERLTATLAGPLAVLLRHHAEHTPPQHATVSSLAASAIARTPLRTANGFLRSLKRYDLRSNLATIKARTVILSGGLDPITPVALARELAQHIPAAQHFHVPPAGHMLLQDAPDAIQLALHHALADSRRCRGARSRRERATAWPTGELRPQEQC